MKFGLASPFSSNFGDMV